MRSFLLMQVLGRFTNPVISNHIFTHLPRSLRVLSGVFVIHLVRGTPADRGGALPPPRLRLGPHLRFILRVKSKA